MDDFWAVRRHAIPHRRLWAVVIATAGLLGLSVARARGWIG